MNIRVRAKILGVCTAALLLAASAQAQVLSYVTGYQDGLDGINGLDGTRLVAISPGGKHVYSAAEVDHSIAVFERHNPSGALTQIQVVTDEVGGVDGLRGVGNLAISPDGRHLYAGAFAGAEREIAVFERDLETGLLTQIQVVREPGDVADGIGFLIWMGVSADGNNVYSASAFDNAVVVFHRDVTTGMITFQQIVRDGVGGVNLMTGTVSAAISQDDQHLYVVSRTDDSIVTFARDPLTGDLSLVQELQDNVGGVDGLDGARHVVIGKNGQQVYVVSLTEHAIAVFQRNEDTGALTFSQTIKDADPGIDGLMGATALAESHNGKFIFAGGFGEDKISVFRRSPASGLLTFVEVKTNSLPDAEGLDGVIYLTVSPNGKHLYSGSFFQDAVVYFDVARN